MQNRYAGDAGDFVKLGLMRHLASDASAGVSVALNWYLAPDESHNADGKHVAYLTADNRHHASLAALDPELMLSLARVVRNRRSVDALERCGALPVGTRTYSEMLVPALGRTGRRAWHGGALAALDGPDVVLVDPDNGIRSGATPRPHKDDFAGGWAPHVELVR